MSETVLECLAQSLRQSAAHDGNATVPPAAVIWPDEDSQWAPIIPELAKHCRILTLGPYDASTYTGPALWLRCAVAGTLDEVPGFVDGPPVMYLPGISRAALKSASASNPGLAPLVPLQYRSQLFSQANGRDWTIRAFLTNEERGLGLSVAADEVTAAALCSGIRELVCEPVQRLAGRFIDAAFVNDLLNPDPVRLLLDWLNDPSAIEESLDPAKWAAFSSQCKVDYGFDPEALGVIEAARRLGDGQGAWRNVWSRLRETPTDYPGIITRLQDAQPPELVPANPGAWPDVNSAAEDALRAALLELGSSSAEEARNRVIALEREHKARRGYVWADLGDAPLALALEHLALVAEQAGMPAPNGDVAAIGQWYSNAGWQVDLAAIRAIGEAKSERDSSAVSAVLDAIYQPWLRLGAESLQSAIGSAVNSGTYVVPPAPSPNAGEVIVFVDGLRMDVARVLSRSLTDDGAEVDLTLDLAPLPTVTPSAKPARVPVSATLLGAGGGLDACRASSGASAGVEVLRSLLREADIEVLTPLEIGTPDGRGWTEAGEFDRRGHELGARLPHELDDEIARVADRIMTLLRAGWSTVTVVTDHGWLLLPSGLPKNEGLPTSTAVVKKGRCARLKEGALVDVPTVPWHWDHSVRIAIAPGISCFTSNQVYEHGGVSPQECFVPRMRVTASGRGGPDERVRVANGKWRGLTFTCTFEGLPDGAVVDLRRLPGDPTSSIAERARVTGGAGKIILLVTDEELEGERVELVVTDADRVLLMQRETTVGSNT